MPLEIERKFLVTDQYAYIRYINGDVANTYGDHISQGYLSENVRVRLRYGDGNEACITIKGDRRGISRSEYTYTIPFEDGEEIIQSCKHIINKKRNTIYYGGKYWEFDTFEGDNKGLVVVEVELESEDEEIKLPNWCGEEVTQDDRYYNYNLAVNP
jgi:adenylate cyclase